MKKNVFQGFSDKVLNNLNLVRGGITYHVTQAPSGPDEDAHTAPGEYDPFNGETNTSTKVTTIDASWENCEGVTATNPRVNGYANGWQRIN